MRVCTLSLLGLAFAPFALAGAQVSTDVDVRIGVGAAHKVREEPHKGVVEPRPRHAQRHRHHSRGWHGHSEPREVVVVETRAAEPQPVLVVKETPAAPVVEPVKQEEPVRPTRSMNSVGD